MVAVVKDMRHGRKTWGMVIHPRARLFVTGMPTILKMDDHPRMMCLYNPTFDYDTYGMNMFLRLC